ncbi:hypothetical protein FQN55_006669 [Onygenales sp. PD_40]|nr:hypothetical protein FQN55_006669 [Onygenales sp. PD_40]KAK2798047.1 hypothetical protein FQN51_007972 [Onygenales sp. PD_10]
MHFKLILFPILFLGQLGHAQQKPSVWGDCDEIRKAPPDRLADLTREQIELLEKVLWPSEEMRKKFKPDEQLKRLKAAKGPEEMRIALMQYCYGNKNLKRDAPTRPPITADKKTKCDFLRKATPEQINLIFQEAENQLETIDPNTLSDKDKASLDNGIGFLAGIQTWAPEKLKGLVEIYCRETRRARRGDIISTAFNAAMEMAKNSAAACLDLKKNGLECPKGNTKRATPSGQLTEKGCDKLRRASPEEVQELLQRVANEQRRRDRSALSDNEKATLDDDLKWADEVQKLPAKKIKEKLLEFCAPDKIAMDSTAEGKTGTDIMSTIFKSAMDMAMTATCAELKKKGFECPDSKTKRDPSDVPAQTPDKKLDCNLFKSATPEELKEVLQGIEDSTKKIDRNKLSDEQKANVDSNLKIIDKVQTWEPEKMREFLLWFCENVHNKDRPARRDTPDIISTAFSTAMEMAKNAAAACMELKKKGLKCNEDEKSIVRDN